MVVHLLHNYLKTVSAACCTFHGLMPHSSLLCFICLACQQAWG